MKTKLIIILMITLSSLKAQENKLVNQIHPGQIWNDTKGHPINAHGGGVLFYGGIYYWYGTHKIEGLSEKTFADGGIHCYASLDLVNWTDQGMVLSIYQDEKKSDLSFGCNFDRPKVVYNAKTRKFVAFFKLYLVDKGTDVGYIGVALSDSPSGPFTYSHKFLGAGTPNGSGDFAIIQEENGDLYHLAVRKPDKAFVVGKMRVDYLLPEGKYEVCNGVTVKTEGPSIVKRNGVYHMICSGSSGWAPNAARYFTSKSLTGPWTSEGNPCEGVNPDNGLGKEKTFGGQSTFILPVNGRKDAYIAIFDINKPENPYDSRAIWLPITIKNDKFSVLWQDAWGLEVFGK